MIDRPQRQQHISHELQQSRLLQGITLGTVVDTNDPQQMGRIRVVCPAWNDDFDAPISMIPWARYATPFGGMTPFNSMGPDESVETDSITTYGMWAIPKIGAQVLVMCIDGNPNFRVWIGCVYTDATPHTMPHGRYSVQDNSDLYATGKPEGPFSTQEQPIQPLYDNLKDAFGTDRNTNYEWKTRGADYSVAAVDKESLAETLISVADDKDLADGDFNVRQGYGLSRIQPEKEYTSTGKNYDSQVYSWVTPGNHAFSMDDRVENCRVRFRTSSGHQLILDDTNERIYISTAKGNNWVEMDQVGNIDIHSERRVSVHAAKDINFTSNETFRVTAKDIHLRASGGIFSQANSSIDLKSSGSVSVSSSSDINLDGGGSVNATASSSLNLNASGNILATGSSIYLNGPPAQTASSASKAYTTNRVPLHEPYARIMVSKLVAESSSDVSGVLDLVNTRNQSSVLDIPYTSANVGRQDYSDEPITRGPHWRR